jgi:hypothetical protein
MEKRKEFKKLLNEVVLEIFEKKEVKDLLLVDVKMELVRCERIKELIESYKKVLNGKSRWMFFEFDDRFERSMGGLDNFEIKRVEVFGRVRRVLEKK